MTGVVLEAKVIASTAVATLVGVGVAILNAVEGNHDLLGSLGPTWQALILAVVPGLLVLGAGYQAKHTPRPTPVTAVPTDPPTTA